MMTLVLFVLSRVITCGDVRRNEGYSPAVLNRSLPRQTQTWMVHVSTSIVCTVHTSVSSMIRS